MCNICFQSSHSTARIQERRECRLFSRAVPNEIFPVWSLTAASGFGAQRGRVKTDISGPLRVGGEWVPVVSG